MFRFLSILSLVFLLAMPVTLAQEAVPEATEAVEVPETPEESPSAGIPVGQLVLIASVAGGLLVAVAAGGPLVLILRRVDKNTKDAAEQLFLGLHPTWQSTITQILDHADTVLESAVEALRLAKEITDGLPNQTPTTTQAVQPQLPPVPPRPPVTNPHDLQPPASWPPSQTPPEGEGWEFPKG